MTDDSGVPLLSEGQSLRIRAFVTLGMGLGTAEHRPRARAARLINRAAAILDKLDRARAAQGQVDGQD